MEESVLKPSISLLNRCRHILVYIGFKPCVIKYCNRPEISGTYIFLSVGRCLNSHFGMSSKNCCYRGRSSIINDSSDIRTDFHRKVFELPMSLPTTVVCGHDDIADPRVKKAVRAQVQAVMPEAAADIRIFNQATMELGATVCAPNGPPRCMECPARDLCLGRLRGTAEELPVKGAKKPRRIEERTVFLLVRQGRIALRKRPGTGLLAGLWEFPNVEGALDEAAAGAAVSAWGLEPRAWESRLAAKHIFTHVEWHMTGYTLEVAGEGPADFVWADAGELADRAVPSAFARYYDEAETRLKED